MKYPELKWAVLCKWASKPYWEPIAAFNSETVAQLYCKDCEEANEFETGGYLTYKVEEIDNG
jgi:hypothetical protein